MSDTLEEISKDEPEVVENLHEEISSEKRPQKNPNRVRSGHRVAAIGQKAKEEKMRKKVKEEMIIPTTWMGVGGALASVALLGFWYLLSSLQTKLTTKEEKKKPEPEPEKKLTNTNYFG